MKMFNWTNVRLVLMMGMLVFLYSFTSNRNAQRKIKKVNIEFSDNNSLFMDQKMVNKLLIENIEDLQSIAKEDLDLNKLEKKVANHNMIQKAEVFVSVDGVLKTVVTQRRPIGRVFDEWDSFYIDYDGTRMPLSENHTARVPVITGNINAVKSEKLAEVLKLIYEDEFLKKNIIGVQITANGSLLMSNRDYDYQIEFGRTINIEKKFSNYKAFYQKAIIDNSLKNYEKINLKFTQQVVCTK